jgi:hypothetical protein
VNHQITLGMLQKIKEFLDRVDGRHTKD